MWPILRVTREYCIYKLPLILIIKYYICCLCPVCVYSQYTRILLGLLHLFMVHKNKQRYSYHNRLTYFMSILYYIVTNIDVNWATKAIILWINARFIFFNNFIFLSLTLYDFRIHVLHNESEYQIDRFFISFYVYYYLWKSYCICLQLCVCYYKNSSNKAITNKRNNK